MSRNATMIPKPSAMLMSVVLLNVDGLEGEFTELSYHSPLPVLVILGVGAVVHRQQVSHGDPAVCLNPHTVVVDVRLNAVEGREA